MLVLSPETFNRYIAVRKEIFEHRGISKLSQLAPAVLAEELFTRGVHRPVFTALGQWPPTLRELFQHEYAEGEAVASAWTG